jgi:hypothetical protein
MRRNKSSESEWLTWEGDDFPRTFHSDSVVFYITGHFDLDEDQELRHGLARAVQREGICSSLGEAYGLLNTASVHIAGYCAEDPEADLPIYCDMDSEDYDWDATYVEVPFVF